MQTYLQSAGAERHIYIQTDKETSRLANRQTDRQTNRQVDIGRLTDSMYIDAHLIE